MNARKIVLLEEPGMSLSCDTTMMTVNPVPAIVQVDHDNPFSEYLY